MIDVSDSAAPVALGTLGLPDVERDVEVAGGFAYVADYRSGLRVVDVSDPRFPMALGALDTPGYVAAVEVAGHPAYLANDLFGLRVIDVADPAAPIELGGVDTPGQVEALAVVNALVYVADGGSGLRMIDVSEPASLLEIGAVNVRDCCASGVALANGLAYLADGLLGLDIVDFGPEYATNIPREVDTDIKPGSYPNSINLSSEGGIAVALLGSASFDLASVDESTLAFEPAGAGGDHSHGPHVEDVNCDGVPDLIGHFRTEQTGIAFGDRAACLEGTMQDGRTFRGCDSLRTVPDMYGDGLLDEDEASIGTHALMADTDGDGFGDGQEVLLMRTDPLDARDPPPVRLRPERHHRRR